MIIIVSVPLDFFMLQHLFPYACIAHFGMGCGGLLLLLLLFFFFFPVFKAIIFSSKILTFSFNISSHSFSSRAFEGFYVLKNCLGFFSLPFL